jgi:hypothetical protein
MTEQHPLTNKDLEALEESMVRIILGRLCLPSDFDLARAAADWQLEQVLEWLKEHAGEYAYEDYYGPCFNDNGLLDDLGEAMRPQQQKENN